MVAKITRKGLEKNIESEIYVRIGDETVLAKLTHFELYRQPKDEDDLTLAEQAFMKGYVSYGIKQPFHAVHTSSGHTYIAEVKNKDLISLPINRDGKKSYRLYKVSLS